MNQEKKSGLRNETAEGSFEVSGEQRKALLDYLKQSEIGKQIPGETETLTDEEALLAERLLSLRLKTEDWSPNRAYSFDEYPYEPDMAKREEIFKKAGLDPNFNNFQLERHDIVLDRMKSIVPAFKVINLVEKEKKELEDGRYEIVSKNLNGGAVLLSKISFEGQPDGNARYVPLTEEEKKMLKKDLDLLESKDKD